MYFFIILILFIKFACKINKINQLLNLNIMIMRKTVIFFILLVSAFAVTNAVNIQIDRNAPPTSNTRQRAPMLTPVVVDLSSTDLYLNFTNSVGLATITVTDSNGNIVQQDSIDTNLNNELYIPVNDLVVGEYTLTISYDSITHPGVFTIE